jgi:hypothetical protein
MLQRSTQKVLAVGPNESLCDFLARTLSAADIQFFTTALENAAARYDRYSANRHAWSKYADRKVRLTRITDLAGALASSLSELDIFSRDELARGSDPREIKALIGSLNLLSNQISEMLKNNQSSGTPRDLAEQLWIEEVADNGGGAH